jgi:adenylate cyclase class 2
LRELPVHRTRTGDVRDRRADPELDGQTFIELETMAEPDDVSAALQVVRDVLAGLGVGEHDLTTESYTDRVATKRGVS